MWRVKKFLDYSTKEENPLFQADAMLSFDIYINRNNKKKDGDARHAI